MQTLKNIKEGDTLTDFRGDEMYVDTIGTIEINDEYIDVYVMKDDRNDWTATYTLKQLEDFEYYIKDIECSDCILNTEEEECDCYDEGYDDGYYDAMNGGEAKLYSTGVDQMHKEMLEVASHEHTFANMQLGLMLATIEEIKEVTEEPIVDMIIENVLERRAIDIAIHSKKILNDKD